MRNLYYVRLTLTLLLFSYLWIQSMVLHYTDRQYGVLLPISYIQQSQDLQTPNSIANAAQTTLGYQLQASMVKHMPIAPTRCGNHVQLVLGHQRAYKGFLTIGLSSVPRENASYLKATLHSLIEETSATEKEDIVIVVFLGYQNSTMGNDIKVMIEENFSDNLDKGELQVVQPELSIYPDFSQIRTRTYNDTLPRVHWRTKQNIDFAYLFEYCDGLSEYYLHVEDDVIAIPDYISHIKRSLAYHNQLKHQWFVLEFGEGFYGMLFRSRDLCMLKTTLLLFKEYKPCDLLLQDLKSIKMHDTGKVIHEKRLFKHMGLYSSLRGKIVTAKPAAKGKILNVIILGTSSKVYYSSSRTNPAAVIETSMEAYLSHTPDLAYDMDSYTYFWTYSPNIGDFYRVILKSPVKTTRVAVRTGHPVTGIDKLESALVFVNKELTVDNKCRSLRLFGVLTSGTFEQAFVEREELKCLEIVVQHEQTNWVMISEVEIET